MKLTLTTFLIFTAITACPGSDKYCRKCDTDTCTACAMSYLNGKVCAAPTTTITNCKSYATATTCAACDYGYYLSTDKKSCPEITISNCKAVMPTDNTKCMVCDDAKQVNPDTGVCTDTNCTLTNCDHCTVTKVGTVSTETCVVCDSDYSNRAGVCVTEPIANCETSDANGCTLCELGYYWNSGACTESDAYSGVGLFGMFYLLFAFFFF